MGTRKKIGEREHFAVKVFKDEYAMLGLREDMTLSQANEAVRTKLQLAMPKRMRKNGTKTVFLARIKRACSEEQLEQIAIKVENARVSSQPLF